MKLIKPSYSIIEPTGYTIDDIYKSIELAGKVSHKSEHTIKEGSAKEFVDRMIRLGHGATLEFGTVYLYIKGIDETNIDKYRFNKYSKVVEGRLDHFYVTSNYRVLVENNWLDDLKYLCEPTEYHEKRVCVKFICDRAIANEFVRHRKFSFLQESTRYCNYSKEKFNNELTFILPCWLDIPEGNYAYWNGGWFNDKSEKIQIEEPAETGVNQYLSFLSNVEMHYKLLLHKGWKPEQARNVLTLSLKTELYMTGFESDWGQFFKLRTASNAHPQVRELAIPLKEEFIKRGYTSEQQDN